MGSGVLESDDFGIYFLLSNIPNLNNGFDYHSASIGYRLKNKRLEKLSYTKLGCIADLEYQVLHVIEGVIAFRIRLYHEKKWLTEWQHSLCNFAVACLGPMQVGLWRNRAPTDSVLQIDQGFGWRYFGGRPEG